MAGIKEIIAGMEVELEASEKRELKARREAEVILATVQQEGRSNMTDDEDARLEELKAARELAKSQQVGVREKLARARAIEAEEAEAETRLRERTPVRPAVSRDKPSYDQVHRVGREERTYNKDSDPTGTQFLRDVTDQFVSRAPAASERLARHMQEERVERHGMEFRSGQDIQTGNMGNGLVVPQYLTDMVAPAVANLRPFADACNAHTLPSEGMSVTIPLISTASSAAVYVENSTGVSDTALDATDLTISVQIAAGGQTVSRASIERGTGIGEIVMQDLFKRYASVLDLTLITQTSNGLKNVAHAANSSFAAGGSDAATAEALYTAILGGASQVDTALLGVAKPNMVVMHGRRWFWLQGQLVSAWPLVGRGPNNGFGSPVGADNGAMYGTAVRGYLPNGMAVVIDDNVPTNLGTSTNNDIVYVTSSDECHLWELPGQPAFIRAEQPLASNLGIQLVVYGYFAYTFARYSNSVQSITGNGLAAPVGF